MSELLRVGAGPYADPYREVPFERMRNPRYTVLVHEYTFGQLRVHLTDREQHDPHAPPGHGAIVRVL